jgi:hypothetical protein
MKLYTSVLQERAVRAWSFHLEKPLDIHYIASFLNFLTSGESSFNVSVLPSLIAIPKPEGCSSSVPPALMRSMRGMVYWVTHHSQTESCRIAEPVLIR